jgi:four helix bundle protein
MKDFRKLVVWQKAHEVTLNLYVITRKFPVEERYGLTSQIRRSSASIGATIAEGCEKGSEVEFGRYLQMSSGSASELSYHLILSRDLAYLSDVEFANLSFKVEEVRRMLASLISKISASKKARAAGAS